VIAIDTNILVYAHRTEMASHLQARQALEQLALSGQRWGIPWPCVHEFLATVTHAKFKSPTPMAVALDAIDGLLSHNTCTALNEAPRHFALLSGLIQRANISGAAIHDARIAAICIGHEVQELWTRDRDFTRYPDLRTRNPLIASLHQPMQRYG
jgi:uncharacterized protein